jgi:hypothetical protein
MRNYRPSAATNIRVDFGVELVAGLRLFPETAANAAPFELLTDQLDDQHTARRALRKPLVKARCELRFANYRTDQTIRQAARAAEIADGGRRGPIFDALFPDGLKPVVAPPGARQIAPTQALVDRLTKSKVAGIDTYRSEWLPKLTASLHDLELAAAAFDEARDAYNDAFETEIALRDQHRTEVDRLSGLVRAAFPHDREKQDLVFPVVEEGDAAPEAAKPAAPNGGGQPPAPAGKESP